MIVSVLKTTQSKFLRIGSDWLKNVHLFCEILIDDSTRIEMKNFLSDSSYGKLYPPPIPGLEICTILPICVFGVVVIFLFATLIFFVHVQSSSATVVAITFSTNDSYSVSKSAFDKSGFIVSVIPAVLATSKTSAPKLDKDTRRLLLNSRALLITSEKATVVKVAGLKGRSSCKNDRKTLIVSQTSSR